MHHLQPEVPSPPILPARGASGSPGLGFVDPVGRRDRAICGALDCYGLIQAWPRKAPAETGQDRLVHPDHLGELTARDVVGFEVMLELVHAWQFAQCARNGQA